MKSNAGCQFFLCVVHHCKFSKSFYWRCCAHPVPHSVHTLRTIEKEYQKIFSIFVKRILMAFDHIRDKCHEIVIWSSFDRSFYFDDYCVCVLDLIFYLFYAKTDIFPGELNNWNICLGSHSNSFLMLKFRLQKNLNYFHNFSFKQPSKADLHHLPIKTKQLITQNI